MFIVKRGILQFSMEIILHKIAFQNNGTPYGFTTMYYVKYKL